MGACGQYYEEDDIKKEHPIAKSFDTVADALDQKISEINALVWATEPPVLFLSMDARTKKRDARKIEKKVKRLEKKLEGYLNYESEFIDRVRIEKDIEELKEQQVYKPNFREGVAKQKGYKENRKGSVKPLHYDNLTEYILAKYDCVMAEGLEADDLLSIYQREALANNPDPTTIICTRDKDLRMVPGMHFGWECGKQSQFGPELVSGLGRLKPIYRGVNRKGEPELVELKGTGMIFFGAQLLVGDAVDNIPGLPRCGVKKAYPALKDVTTIDEMFLVIKGLYVAKYGEDWEAELLEQGRLLWMLEKLNEDGSPVMWEIPKCLY